MPLGGAIASLVVLLLMADQWRWIFVIGGVAPLLIAVTMTKWMPASLSQDASADSAHITGGALRELFGRERLLSTLLLWVGFFLMQVTFQLMLNWLPLLMQA